MADQATILKRIRKLLALSKSDNVNESSAALAMAQRLMTENAINEAELSTGAEAEFELNAAEVIHGKILTAWRARLASVVGHYNGCVAVQYGKGVVKIIGKEIDVAGAVYIYQFCEKEIDRLAKIWGGVEGTIRGASWRNSFRHGVVDVIALKLREEDDKIRVKYRNQERALAIVDSRREKVEDRLGKMKTRSLLEGGTDAHARFMGHMAGEALDLSRENEELAPPAAGELED